MQENSPSNLTHLAPQPAGQCSIYFHCILFVCVLLYKYMHLLPNACVSAVKEAKPKWPQCITARSFPTSVTVWKIMSVPSLFSAHEQKGTHTFTHSIKEKKKQHVFSVLKKVKCQREKLCHSSLSKVATLASVDVQGLDNTFPCTPCFFTEGAWPSLFWI